MGDARFVSPRTVEVLRDGADARVTLLDIQREGGYDALTIDVRGLQWWWEFQYPVNGGRDTGIAIPPPPARSTRGTGPRR